MFLNFILFALLACGFFMLGLSLFKVPTYARSGVVKSLMAQAEGKTSPLNDIVYGLSEKVEKLVRLSPFSKEELTGKLKSLDINMTAERYMAGAIVKAALVLLFIVPALLVFPLISLVVVIAAVMVFFFEKNKADNLLDEKRKIFDKEVPRFARVLSENLARDRDVISIFEKYKETAVSPHFKREIDRTVADAKISSVPEALIRFDERINSKFLSDVIRGLLSVVNGSEGVAHFNMIVRDIKKEEYEMLKKEAMKRPDKLKKWSMALFIVFISSFFLVIVLDVIRQVQMFNSVN
jgi:hypothetical protein